MSSNERTQQQQVAFRAQPSPLRPAPDAIRTRTCRRKLSFIKILVSRCLPEIFTALQGLGDVRGNGREHATSTASDVSLIVWLVNKIVGPGRLLDTGGRREREGGRGQGEGGRGQGQREGQERREIKVNGWRNAVKYIPKFRRAVDSLEM